MRDAMMSQAVATKNEFSQVQGMPQRNTITRRNQQNQLLEDMMNMSQNLENLQMQGSIGNPGRNYALGSNADSSVY